MTTTAESIKSNLIKTNYNKNSVKILGTKPLSKEITELPYVNYSVVPEEILKTKVAESRLKLLAPITSRKEYGKLLAETQRYTIVDGAFITNLINMYGYDHIPSILKGLVSYCGLGDISGAINTWLTGRSINSKFSEFISDRKMANIVRVFEYSLSRLDDLHKPFKGKVYRVGYFNPNTDKQYYSASLDIDCVKKHSQDNPPSAAYPYSIIKVKNGHNIYEFQKDTNTSPSRKFAETEQEILIDRKSKFRKVPPEEYTAEDINDILKVINSTMQSDKPAQNIENFDQNTDILKWISVWEEI